MIYRTLRSQPLSHILSVDHIIKSGCVLLLVFGLIPVSARLFEFSMISHMLIQLPLLAVVGMVMLQPNRRIYRVGVSIDPHGLIALIVASGSLFFWMLPLNLDLATIDPIYRILKIVSVPLGIGLALKWVWLKGQPIIKLLILFEGWATAARLGWLYLESPIQLCSSYLIGEQRMVGQVLLILSAAAGVIGLLYIIFGSYEIFDNARLEKIPENP